VRPGAENSRASSKHPGGHAWAKNQAGKETLVVQKKVTQISTRFLKVTKKVTQKVTRFSALLKITV
jgi:hypothetical protein